MIQLKDTLIEEMILKYALNDRIVILSEEISRNTIFKVKYLIERIVKLDKERGIKPKDAEPIIIRIDSYGGCANSTMHLVSYIFHLRDKGQVFITEACGAVMSGGFKILLAGNYRKSHRYCDIMVHQPNSFVYNVQSLQDKKIDYEQTKELWELLKTYISENSYITKEQLDEYVDKNRNWHMRPKEALELGVIDEIY